MTRFGTSHFVSFGAAVRYYREYGNDWDEIERKFRDGEFSVGKPPIKTGEHLSIIRDEGRYQIETP